MKLANSRYGLYTTLQDLQTIYPLVDIEHFSYEYGHIVWENQKSDDLGIDWTERKEIEGNEIYYMFSKGEITQSFWHAQKVDEKTVMISGWGDVWFKFHD